MRVEDLQAAHEQHRQRDDVDPVHDAHRQRVAVVEGARRGIRGDVAAAVMASSSHPRRRAMVGAGPARTLQCAPMSRALRHPDAGPDPRRARQRRPARRRPPARAQQLREPRLPRAIATRRRRSSSSSTARAAGPTRRSWKSTRSWPSSPSARFPRWRRSSSTAARCTMTTTSASPCIRGAAGARRSSTTATRSTWIGRFIGRIHAVGALAPFAHRPGARHRTPSATSRATSCSRTISCPTTCARPMRRVAAHGARRRARLLRARRRCRARCACTATATRATCCGRDDGPHFVDFDDARTGPGRAGPVDAAVGRSRER